MGFIHTLHGILLCFVATLSAYTQQNCGDLFLTANDTFKYLNSPGYPVSYQNNVDCVWTIEAEDRSEIVHAEVLQSKLESRSSGKCKFDNVSAYDGRSTYVQLSTWCGHETQTVRSSGPALSIRFTTDDTIVHLGFQIAYRQTPADVTCGQYIKARSYSQYFTSPGYPQQYENNLHCVWIIKSTESNLKLVVTDSHLEYRCTSDSVKVYNGEIADSSQLLGTFCGQEKPTYISSTSVVRVEFVTDGNGQNQGFKMSYSGGHFVRQPDHCNSTSLAATYYSRYLTSPGYPNGYQEHVDCTWTIKTVITGWTIKLSFSDADINDRDRVYIYDGSTTHSSSLLGTVYASQTPTFVSSGNTAMVQFQTSERFLRRGFKLSYRSGDFQVCEDRKFGARTSSEEITSPFYPSDYPLNVHCTWRIDTFQTEWVVYIEVTVMDIEYQPRCYSDYLQAFDGYDVDDRSLGKWCGTTTPEAAHSSGQSMFIVFHSDANIQKTGFKLQYSSKLKSDYVNQSANIGGIVGGIAAGSILIVSVICLVAYRVRKTRSRTDRPERSSHTSAPSAPQTSTQQFIYTIGGEPPAPASFDPPPSYEEVMDKDQGRPAEGCPPPYSSVGFL